MVGVLELRHPTGIIIKPSYYNRLLLSGTVKEFENFLYDLKLRENLIVLPQRGVGIYSCNPKNLRRFSSPMDITFSSNLILPILKDILRNYDGILFWIGSPNNGGFSAYDLINKKMIGEHKPYVAIGSFSIRPLKRLIERREKIKNWFSERGIVIPERLEKEILKIDVNWDEERKKAKLNKKIIAYNFSKILERYNSVDKLSKLRIWLFSPNTVEAKIVKLGIREFFKGDKEKSLRFFEDHVMVKKFDDKYFLKKLVSFVNYVTKSRITLKKIEKYFPKIKEDFIFPPYFNEEFHSFTVFPEDYLRDFVKNKLLPLTPSKEINIKAIREFYKNHWKTKDIWEELPLKKKCEIFPPIMPIEVFVLLQEEKVGYPLKPFTKELPKLKLSPTEKVVSVRCSQLSAPTIFDALVSKFDVRIETDRIKMLRERGTLYHSLCFGNSFNSYTENELIWPLFGKAKTPISRKNYTEKEFTTKIKIDDEEVPLIGHLDIVLEKDGYLVPIDVKTSIVFPEVYKKLHRNQLTAYKIGLESLGFKVSNIGILLYAIFPNFNDGPPIRPTNRYAYLSEEKIVMERIKEIYESIKAVLKNPEVIDKIARKYEDIEEKTNQLKQKIKYLKRIYNL